MSEVLYFGGHDGCVVVRLPRDAVSRMWRAVETREAVDIDLGLAGKFKAEVNAIKYNGDGMFDVTMHRTTPVEFPSAAYPS